MFPKAYIFHNDELKGIENIISSPMILTFNTRDIFQKPKFHQDVLHILKLYQVINNKCFPKLITTIYNFNKHDILALVLKFNISHYCQAKSESHISLAKDLFKVSKKLGSTMQNISGLEKSLFSTHKNLTELGLDNDAPMTLSEIGNLSTILLVRKTAHDKLTKLIQAEFIDGFC